MKCTENKSLKNHISRYITKNYLMCSECKKPVRRLNAHDIHLLKELSLWRCGDSKVPKKMKGYWYCKRDPSHEGPCAAVPR